MAISAAIVYSAWQMKTTFAKNDERHSYDLYYTLLKKASRVYVWKSKTARNENQEHVADECPIIINYSEGTIRQVSILVHWDLLKHSRLRAINLQHNKDDYCQVPGFGHHHTCRTLLTADWVISMDPDKRFVWSLPTICSKDIFKSPRFLDKGDTQDRCRLTAVATKFTDVYGNIRERLFESEYLPRDRTSPDNRLADFCQPKSIIAE